MNPRLRRSQVTHSKQLRPCTHLSLLRLLRTGSEAPVFLGPQSRPTYAPSVVKSRSRPTDSERTVPVEYLRGIDGGHVGHGGAAQEGLTPPSYGKHTATAPNGDSGAPGATAHGAVVENHGASGGRNNRRSAGGQRLESQWSREGATCKISSKSASEQNIRDVSPSNRPTLITNEVGTTPREGGRAAAGDSWRWGIQLHVPRRRKDVSKHCRGNTIRTTGRRH